jgi:uncharacterized protein YozE (UPF0346 family)
MSMFTTWLREQANRDDPIGDLANDSLRDSRWPEHGTTLEEFASVIRYSGAGNSSGAMAALYEAWEEWSGEPAIDLEEEEDFDDIEDNF